MMQNKTFNISDVFKESWSRVKGVKGSYWGAILLNILILWGVGMVVEIIFLLLSFALGVGGMQAAAHTAEIYMPTSLVVLMILQFLADIALQAGLALPMFAGIILIGLRRAADKPVSAMFIFRFFKLKYIIRLFLLSLFMTVILMAPVLIIAFLSGLLAHMTMTLPLKSLVVLMMLGLVILEVYVLVAYALAYLALIDRDISAWRAMELSRQVITESWFKVFGLLILMVLVNIIAAIPLGIGLIWSIPFTYNLFAVTYGELIGFAGQDPVTIMEQNPV